MDLFHSPKFASRVEELIKKHHVPGLAIAIVQNETVASAGFGQASLDPPKPCTADTLFDIASASKSLTAASVGLLVDDDKYPHVKYDAIMSKLLPEDFVMAGVGYTEGVTVEDVLSHRTGMPSHDSSYLGPNAAQPDDARSVTRNLRNLPVAAPLRYKFMYCNLMYTVATHLVEEVSGLCFSEFLQERIFLPLGMESSNLQPEGARAKGLGDRIATGYLWEEDAQEYKGFQYPDTPEAQGAGSIITSVNDYVKWVKAMMNQEGPVNEDVYKGLIRSTDTAKNRDYEKLNPHTSPELYAAGWEVYNYRGHMVVVHDGSIAGVGTRHFFLPGVKFGGAIFGNSDGSNQVCAVLAQELIDEVLKVPEDERPDWDKIESERYSEDDDKEEEEKFRQQLCPSIKESEPQTRSLSAYTGEYWNEGYKGMTVQVKDDQLFVDATDRSMGFTLTFDHVCEQNKYIAHLSDVFEGGDEPLKSEFKFEDGKAVKMGLHIEKDLEEYIWFDRLPSKSSDYGQSPGMSASEALQENIPVQVVIR